MFLNANTGPNRLNFALSCAKFLGKFSRTETIHMLPDDLVRSLRETLERDASLGAAGGRSRGKRLRSLIYSALPIPILVFCLTGCSGGNLQRANFDDCLEDKRGCIESRLSAVEHQKLSQARHLRHYQECMEGRRCDQNSLSSAQTPGSPRGRIPIQLSGLSARGVGLPVGSTLR